MAPAAAERTAPAAPAAKRRPSRHRGRGRAAIVGRRAHRSITRPHGRHGAAASRERLAHAAEEAPRTRRHWLIAELCLKVVDVRIRALERLVLDERGLDQRVDGVGGSLETLLDGAISIRIALRIFERREAIE